MTPATPPHLSSPWDHRMPSQKGVDVEAYAHRVFLMPENTPGCTMGGVGQQVGDLKETVHIGRDSKQATSTASRMSSHTSASFVLVTGVPWQHQGHELLWVQGMAQAVLQGDRLPQCASA